MKPGLSMSAFDFLAVLFSVILGLALTQILQGLRALMLARSRVTIYWPALIWAALMILIVAQAWWGMYSMRSFQHWTFAMYGVVVVQTTLMYLAAGMALADIPAEGPIDMRAMYFTHRGWFFGLIALTVAITWVKDFTTMGHLSSLANAAILALYLVLSAVAAITKWRWYHALLAPFSVVAMIFNSAMLSQSL